MSHTALEPETLAIVSHFLCVPLKFDRGLVDNPNVTPSLRGLFPLSDLWHSSQPRHIGRLRSLLTKLRLVLSQSKPRLKLCRWLGGNVQRIQHSLFFTVINSHIYSKSRLSVFILNKRFLWGGVSGEPQRTTPYSSVWTLNLLSQQVHQVSSVGAGMFPLTRDTIFFYSLVILYQTGQKKSS